MQNFVTAKTVCVFL